MKSLLKLFRQGPGPSSSHTIAPSLAAESFKKKLINLSYDHLKVTLHGSLALTGEGHGTEKAIQAVFAPIPTEFARIIACPSGRPNAFEIAAYQGESLVLECHYSSIGGGELLSNDDYSVLEKDIYPFRNLAGILSFMQGNSLTDLKKFCLCFEEPSIDRELSAILKAMFASVGKGLVTSGKIPSNKNPRLQLSRTAPKIYEKALKITDPSARSVMLISAYAYAVSEGNACGEKIVTAPTCGSSGVLPAILYYEYHDKHRSFKKVRDALYVAGIFGNLVKQNASIAGAIGGCQAEIGTASSMAAAALCSIEGLSLHQQEYAAECAMEHFLGLSCDPVDGYVIIPCIERNGMGALRAYEAYYYAKFIAPLRQNQVSFDNVVAAMKLTGDSLSEAYKETAEGGLAEILKDK